MKNVSPEDINEELVTLKEYRCSAIKKDEAKYIYDLLNEKNLCKTLEIGFAFGNSTAHIIAATNSNHIAIDPFQEIYFQNLGIKNLEKLGLEDRLIFVSDYSHNVLPLLLKEHRKFDFIFIDGGHRFDFIFIDFYYSDLLLEKGGYFLFHDTWMRSVQLVLSFIAENRKDYKRIDIPLKDLALVQKVGDDDRDAMFYKEFFTYKSIITHNVKMLIRSFKRYWNMLDRK